MPPRSKAEARFLFSQKPEIAARWKAEGAMSNLGSLPEHVKKAAARRTSKESNYTPDGDKGSVL